MSAENLKNIETHFAFGKNWASYAGLLSLPEVGFEYIDRDGAGHIGSSATSLNKLGKAKGYDLFACTITNSIYLRDNLFSKLERNRTTVEQAFDNTFVCYAFKNFASELVLSNRNLQKPCAALDMPTSRNGPNIHFPAINHFTL